MTCETLKWVVLAMVSLTVFVCSVVAIANLTSGPPGPPPCGKGGIEQIVHATDSDGNTGRPLIICNNGNSYWP